MRIGFKVLYGGPGMTTVRPGNLDRVEDVKHDLETLYMWLWSMKDYLVNALQERMGTASAKRMVESFVDRTPDLQITSDVANTAKHVTLRRSRTGRYARIGHYRTVSPVVWPEEGDSSARRRVRDVSRAYIAVEDQNGNDMGDAVEIACRAGKAWEEFAAQHGISTK